MASSALCRICSRSVISKHSVALFSRSGVAERLSRVINSPVVAISGHSEYICRPCNRKFLAAEAFIVLAKSSNEKQQLPSITSGHPSAVVTGTTTPRKRAKDTSGAGASPHTQVCRPAPKRQTVAGYGRRLNFCIEDDGMVIKFS